MDHVRLTLNGGRVFVDVVSNVLLLVFPRHLLPHFYLQSMYTVDCLDDLAMLLLLDPFLCIIGPGTNFDTGIALYTRERFTFETFLISVVQTRVWHQVYS